MVSLSGPSDGDYIGNSCEVRQPKISNLHITEKERLVSPGRAGWGSRLGMSHHCSLIPWLQVLTLLQESTQDVGRLREELPSCPLGFLFSPITFFRRRDALDWPHVLLLFLARRVTMRGKEAVAVFLVLVSVNFAIRSRLPCVLPYLFSPGHRKHPILCLRQICLSLIMCRAYLWKSRVLRLYVLTFVQTCFARDPVLFVFSQTVNSL